MSKKDVFQQETRFAIDPGILGQGTTFTVPAEKRLVIEQVGAAANLPSGQKLHYYIVSTTVQGALANYFFDPANNPKFSSTHHVRFYADPNTQVELFADRDQPQGRADIFISVSGY